MTADDLPLDELERLDAGRTPGPWHVASGREVRASVLDTDVELCSLGDDANAEFIAAIANAAPDLIAAARERNDLLSDVRHQKLRRQALRAQRDEARAELAELKTVNSAKSDELASTTRQLDAARSRLHALEKDMEESDARFALELDAAKADRDKWERIAREQGTAYTEVELLGHAEAERRKAAEARADAAEKEVNELDAVNEGLNRNLARMHDGIRQLADEWETHAASDENERLAALTNNDLGYWGGRREATQDAVSDLRALLAQPDNNEGETNE